MTEIDISLGAIAHIHALSFAYGSANEIDWQTKCPGIHSKMIEDKDLVASSVSNLDLFKEDLKANNAAQEVIDAVDKLAANHKNVFKKFTNVHDSRFLIHGDYWSNNIMFGPSNSLKIFDLQFFASGLPCMDWANMALNEDLIKSNLDRFYKVYYEAFKSTCDSLGVEAPVKIEDFIQDLHEKGIPRTFIFMTFFYDSIREEPNIAE